LLQFGFILDPKHQRDGFATELALDEEDSGFEARRRVLEGVGLAPRDQFRVNPHSEELDPELLQFSRIAVMTPDEAEGCLSSDSPGLKPLTKGPELKALGFLLKHLTSEASSTANKLRLLDPNLEPGSPFAMAKTLLERRVTGAEHAAGLVREKMRVLGD